MTADKADDGGGMRLVCSVQGLLSPHCYCHRHSISNLVCTSQAVSTVLWHPVCGLYCRQAVVFLHYMVGHRLQEESKVKTIVNNSAADTHIFLLRHCPKVPYIYISFLN